jgi:hypothetical protein
LQINAIDPGENASGVAAYSFDDGTTRTTSNTEEVTSNGVYDTRVKDNKGNISQSVSTVVDKIDTTSPDFSYHYTTEQLTIDDAVDRANENGQAVGLHAEPYRLNNGEWQASNTFSISGNGTYEMEVRDALQNSRKKTMEINDPVNIEDFTIV